MNAIILHHYPQSPVSEKVRVALGIKGLAWRSVLIPRLPPKPDLLPLTGGYRRTPVMQIGAEVYCDSQRILQELDTRHPACPDNASDRAFSRVIGRWSDGLVFERVIAVVFGDQADHMPLDFVSDRGRLYFGASFDLERLRHALPHSLAQLCAEITWLETLLADGRAFVLGARPTISDACCYYLVWFVRGRYSEAERFLARFPRLCAWEQRVKAIGHGESSEMSSGEALAVARAATPRASRCDAADDPQDIAGGTRVSVQPEAAEDSRVTGEIVRIDANGVSLKHSDSDIGDVLVHFPRLGYRVTVLP